MDVQNNSVTQLCQELVAGNRNALAKAITLIESTKDNDRLKSEELLNLLIGHSRNTMKIGISGVPGVGKSTFIEALGNYLTTKGKTVAVLTIDPSSPHSHGSIMADKTRMEKLASKENAFIRPSPARGSLGGVTNKTRETIILCEAAGFEVIVVETVGVGQSETAVKSMTDFFLLLALAGAGDELQGIKRGIMEMADLVAVNKADGTNVAPASLAKKMYENALQLILPNESGWSPMVLTCSAIKDEGIEDIWNSILSYYDTVKKSNYLDELRRNQLKQWLNQTIEQSLIEWIRKDENLKNMLSDVEDEVLQGKKVPASAVRKVISAIKRI